MDLICDESVDAPIVQKLRQDGHRVVSVAEMCPGIDDSEVLALANSAQAIVITVDKDFGDMVVRDKSEVKGIVLLRLHGLPSDDKCNLVSKALTLPESLFERSIAVVSPDRLRLRPIP